MRSTAYVPIPSVKMYVEALSMAETSIGYLYPYGSPEYDKVSKVLTELLRELAAHRPTGSDGKHGERHTFTCGCSD